MNLDNIDEHHVLHLMHNDIWVEELLSNYFAFIVDNLLTKRQKQILELKVQYQDEDKTISDNEIATLFNVKVTTINRQIKIIKSKFRNKMELRVDPQVVRARYTDAQTKIQKEKKTKTNN